MTERLIPSGRVDVTTGYPDYMGSSPLQKVAIFLGDHCTVYAKRGAVSVVNLTTPLTGISAAIDRRVHEFPDIPNAAPVVSWVELWKNPG